MGSASITGRIS
ncbi:hypothetical protein ECPA39_1191, partial [Escherichia coli PA39]